MSAIVKDDVGRELKQGTSEDRGALVAAYRVQARLRDRLSTLGWFTVIVISTESCCVESPADTLSLLADGPSESLLQARTSPVST